MEKPELGPPPIFEEELGCKHKCSACGLNFERGYAHYGHQKNAEKRRLEKALMRIVFHKREDDPSETNAQRQIAMEALNWHEVPEINEAIQ